MSGSAGVLTPRTPGATADDSFCADSPTMALPSRLQYGEGTDAASPLVSGGDDM
jgi:hypothetical protein